MVKFKALCAGLIGLAVVVPTASADPVGGTKFARDRIYPEQEIVYDMDLRAEEVTRVRVKGDGDGDIDCWLYDSNGHLVDFDTDSSDTCLLGITPKWTGAFRLKIQNRGSIYSDYALIAD